MKLHCKRPNACKPRAERPCAGCSSGNRHRLGFAAHLSGKVGEALKPGPVDADTVSDLVDMLELHDDCRHAVVWPAGMTAGIARSIVHEHRARGNIGGLGDNETEGMNVDSGTRDSDNMDNGTDRPCPDGPTGPTPTPTPTPTPPTLPRRTQTDPAPTMTDRPCPDGPTDLTPILTPNPTTPTKVKRGPGPRRPARRVRSRMGMHSGTVGREGAPSGP